MSKKKHILVVDDHYEMQEFLRSMLTVGHSDYQVTCVPSAEEGQLELLTTPYDLLITDLRLPGMSGFDLVKRVNRIRSKLPIIMISGTVDIDWEKETSNLNIVDHFAKPLSVDDVLATVRVALYGEQKPTPKKPSPPTLPMPLVSSDMVERLESLRIATGAVRAVLARVDGQIMVNVGDRAGYDMPVLIEIIARNIGGSFQLAKQLGTEESLAIQYQSGADFDVYSANVGRQYLMVLFFSANARRGRIGTIWVFAQRAIKDLLKLLNHKPKTIPVTPSPQPPVTPSPEPSVTPSPEPSATPLPKLPTPLPQPSPSTTPSPLPPLPTTSLPDGELDDFWEVVAEENAGNANLISFEDAQKQGLVDFALPTETAVEPLPDLDLPLEEIDNPLDLGLGDLDPSVDIEGFWSDAISGEDLTSSQGMSFAEAMKQGLIPDDLSVD